MQNRTGLAGLSIGARARQAVRAHKLGLGYLGYIAAGFVSANAFVLGGLAPFGVAFAASAKQKFGAAAILGATLGYLFSLDVLGNVKYIVAMAFLFLLRWVLSSGSLLKGIRPSGQALTALALGPPSLAITFLSGGSVYDGVLAVAELLRRQPLNEAALAHVQTIIDSSETLLETLQDALDLARAQAGELELKPAPTPLRAVMDEVQTLWAPRAAQDGVTLMVGYEGDTELAGVLDSARLSQVFNNLIGHALKFARNGMVEASLKAVVIGDQVRLEARVRDDGPGVDPARIDQVFDHGAGPDGAGLGLSISRHLVEQMDGRIWVENNIGRGATFAFDLSAPRAILEQEAPSNVSTLNELDLQARPHVLIADDNATNRVVAQALCEMFGCTSETVEDGQEALEAVQVRSFDLILMDIKMPRLDGVQATQAIRALPGDSRNIPIVALTANADPEDARHYLAVGMAAVVEKPIKPERLRMAMNAALASEASKGADTPAARKRPAA